MRRPHPCNSTMALAGRLPASEQILPGRNTHPQKELGKRPRGTTPESLQKMRTREQAEYASLARSIVSSFPPAADLFHAIRFCRSYRSTDLREDSAEVRVVSSRLTTARDLVASLCSRMTHAVNATNRTVNPTSIMRANRHDSVARLLRHPVSSACPAENQTG